MRDRTRKRKRERKRKITKIRKIKSDRVSERER